MIEKIDSPYLGCILIMKHAFSQRLNSNKNKGAVSMT
mgnify:CR=1 FL=1